ncbi:MAG: hypothetical protein DHS20C16_21870 [Phycisphaerae bacterium]|nr:MAG: hypothetical protein DHS20C16_21870 [Phycisphaerae bacterium]
MLNGSDDEANHLRIVYSGLHPDQAQLGKLLFVTFRDARLSCELVALQTRRCALDCRDLPHFAAFNLRYL